MSSKNKISFTPLDRGEKDQKINQFVDDKSQLFTIWIKGKAERYELSPVGYTASTGTITLKNDELKLADGSYCLSFEQGGSSFFTQGTLKKVNDGYYKLQVTGKVYKSEKRQSFRLLTYPTYKVHAYIHVEYGRDENSNVYEIKTKKTRTEIYKNFLKLISGKDAELRSRGYHPFRIQDISATGMAIIVGKNDGEWFSNEKPLQGVIINFKGQELKIPSCEVVYKNKYVQQDRNKLEVYKVGIKFKGVDFSY
jgi:hypothetical protein